MAKNTYLIPLTIFCFLFSVLVADDSFPNPFEIQVSQENGGILHAPPASFSPKDMAAYAPQIPKVNVITGEYCEEEVDLVVAGIEPISLRRFYGHLGHRNQAYGHWTFNPESQVLFNFESMQNRNKFMGVGEENGSTLLCEKDEGGVFTFDTVKNNNFAHAITGNNHPLNYRFTVNREQPGRNEYYWDGVISDGSGRKRSYSTEIGVWNATPDSSVAQVSQAWIKEDRKPNGNILRYTYEDFNRFSKSNRRYKYLNTFYILRSISAHSSTGVFLGSLQLEYNNKLHGKRGARRRYIQSIGISGSDGRKVSCYNQIRPIRDERVNWWRPEDGNVPEEIDVVLDHMESPGKPTQHYSYRQEHKDHYFEAPFLYQTLLDENHRFETVYDLNTKKVISQKAPLGPKGEMVDIATYDYHPAHTIVYDAEGNKTIYGFSGEKRIIVIEKYQGDDLYSVERNEWDLATGNLRKQTIEDSAGNLCHFTEFVYDKNHNTIEETVGDGKESHTTYRTFSDDGFNLLLSESDRPEKLARYAYVPDTNLPLAAFLYENGKIRKRSFHFYDEAIPSVCVKTLIDDGQDQNPNDLTGVTYRKIVEIKPKRELPCIGLPEEVLEKTIDPSGREILLKKIHYAYHPSGKIQQEDHYDANDCYRCSIINEYDENELLVAITDSRGQRITREYDEYHNLIVQTGPCSDMRKEWTYDRAQRPIEERTFRADGSVLTKTTAYDKLSRPIHSYDEKGKSTDYQYDALGRATQIKYNFDAQKNIEYDLLGNPIAQTDVKGYQTFSEYNYQGKPTKITYPDGSIEYYTYNPQGTVATQTDKNGTTLCYAYDIFDNPTKIEIYSSDGTILKVKQATYSPFCGLSQTDASGVTTFYTYDFAGRKISESVDERKIDYTYDELGRLTTTQKGDTLYHEIYDDFDRVIEKRTEMEDGTVLRREQYQYDLMGNCTHLITSKGVTETTYDTTGQPLQIKDPLGAITTIEYEGYSKVVTTTDPKGIKTIQKNNFRGQELDREIFNHKGEKIHKEECHYDNAGNLDLHATHCYDGTQAIQVISDSWIYGPMNRKERLLESEKKETRYTYDEKGHLKTIIKPSGIQIHHAYDELGRLARYYSDDIDYHYIYDVSDRILSVYDDVSQTITTREYNDYGDLIHEILANGLTLSHCYDTYGRKTKTTLFDNTEITYTYRGDDLYQVNRNGQIYTYAQRDLDGNITQIQLPNQIGTLSIQRDALSRYQEIISPGYQAYFSSDAYDSVGNLCHYTHRDSSGEYEEVYHYDDLNQLISENSHTYQYDSLNNRLAKDEYQHKVNTLNQLTTDGDHLYDYDPDGNLISDGEYNYVYDSLDRLISLTKRCQTILFTYDPFHRRMAKKVYNGCWRPVSRTYIWDGENEIGAVAGSKALELRVLGEGLGAEIGAATFIELGGKSYVAIHDHRGNVVSLLDFKTGKSVENYRYTAFGEEQTEGTFCPWRYSSKRVDPETGYVYFGRRYYKPSIGRWITPDPLGFEDGPNLYAYLHANPMTDFDLYGLWGNPFAGTRSAGDFCGRLLRPAFATLEFTGKNFIPFPGIRDVVEATGRWGQGGKFFELAEYRTNYNRIHTVQGKQIEGVTPTLENGVGTTFAEALKEAEACSAKHGDAQLDLIYNGTHGLITDLIECCMAKLGVMAPVERMTAYYYSSKLEADPNHIFYSYVHSQAGTHLMNAGKLLTSDEKSHINVFAFAPSTLIPNGIFGSAKNYISRLDLIPMTSTLRYLKALTQKNSNVKFLSPTSRNPLTEHSLMGNTYWQQMTELGKNFREIYGL